MKPYNIAIIRDQALVLSRVYKTAPGVPLNNTGWVGELTISFIPQFHGESGVVYKATEVAVAGVGSVVLGGVTGSAIGTIFQDKIELLSHDAYMYSFWIAPDRVNSIPVLLSWGLLELTP